MEITLANKRGVKVVHMEGSMSTDVAYDVADELRKALQDRTKYMLINLENVEYISSNALRVFLSIGKELDADGGALRLCCLNDSVQEVFDISGFSSFQMFRIFDTEAAALEGF